MTDSGIRMFATGKQAEESNWRAISKGVLSWLLPGLVVVIAVTMVFLSTDESARMKGQQAEERHTVDLLASGVNTDIKQVSSDLAILSHGRVVESLWDDDGTPIPELLLGLSQDFLKFSMYRELYDQMRLLDEVGTELVRVEFNGGRPFVVPRQELQNKKGRYYFDDAFRLNRGEVFVSPLDLNIEYGEIEQPRKPMIRFATPVFDQQGKKRGIVLFNYFGTKLIEQLSTPSHSLPGSQVMLLNADGYWLKGLNPDDEWGFMYQGRTDRTFASVHPVAWQRITSEETSQFETARGLFTATTVYPLITGQKSSTGSGQPFSASLAQLEPQQYHWKVVSWVPHDVLYTDRNHLRMLTALAVALLVLAMSFGAWRGAKAAYLRSLAEQKLRHSEGTLRSIVDNSATVIFLKDLSGRYLLINRQFENLFHLSNDAIFGKTDFDVFPEDVAKALQERDRRVLQEGKPISVEEEVPHDDGMHTYLTTKFPLVGTDGEAYAVCGIATDITERKRAEKEQFMHERQFQHSQKLESLGVLAGGIAHDFNNILMAILGYADLAMADLATTHPALSSVREIEKGARRAAELTRQMLAYSGKGDFVVEAMDVSVLMDDMAHLLRTSIARTITLNLNLKRSLPSIQADVAQMQQVVMNLITNAAEAIGDESGVIILETGEMDCTEEYLGHNLVVPISPETTPPAGGYVYFEVSDTGCGMDEETKARIFEPFFTTKFTGRGLGMAAVLGIVRGHKGAIILDTEPGQGSTFRVLLPAMPGEYAGVQEVNHESTELAYLPTQGAILVVDDEAQVRTLMTAMLERFGFTVFSAADGREGIDLFRRHASEIACVILDLTMPQMNGEACFEELRQIRDDVRVILTSGYNEEEISQRFDGRGLAGFLQKPFIRSTLRQKLVDTIGS